MILQTPTSQTLISQTSISTQYPLRYHVTADRRYALLVRDGTFDSSIVHMVYDNDEYQLPEAPSERAAVLDIGAHIGAFSLLAATRGYVVHAYEAHLLNYQLLVANTQPSTTILPFFAAVFGHHPWESTTLYTFSTSFVRDQNMDNTGGMAAHPVTHPAAHPTQDLATKSDVSQPQPTYTPAMSFDAALFNLLTISRPEYIIVKLDCEGAEDSIFRNSATIVLADVILAEYHFGYEAAETYAQRLRAFDYHVTITPVTRSLGYLRAFARSK